MQIKMRKIIAILSVMAMLCTVLPFGALSVSASSNLVVNGDFETGNYSGWSKNGMTPTVSADAAHSGSYGVHLYGTSGWASFNQYITLKPSTMYHISFWYKSASDATQSAGFEVKTKDGDGKYNVKTVFANTGGKSLSLSKSNTDWKKLEAVFTTADSGDMSHLFTIYRGNGTTDAANPTSVYVDDVVLSELSVDSNMLVNGGFEGTLNPWTQYTSSSQSMSLQTDAHTGSNSVKVPWLHRNLSVSQVVEVEANTDYVVTFYYKSLDSEVDKDMLFGVYNLDAANNGSATGDLAGAATHLKPTNTEWTQAAYVFNSGSNTSVRAAFSGNSSSSPANGNRQFMLVDDVVMCKIGGDSEEPETPVEPDPEPEPEPETPTYGDLVNGDFEGEGGWTISGGVVETIDGDKALKGTTSSRYDTIAQQIITVKPNTDYVLSLNTKYVGSHASGMARVHVYKGASGSTEALDSSNTYYWNTTANTWEGHQLLFNAGDETQVRILVQQHAAPASGTAVDGNIYFDDFVVTEKKTEVGYVGSYPETMTSGADIRFMTYNVLVGQDTNKGGYSWGQPIGTRPEKACTMINYYKPDVIALEEFSGEWYEYFQANMTDYAFGIMESKDSQNNGILYTCLAYNKNTIRLLDTDLFRNTVSRWGTQGMRYVNVGFFEVIATGEKFIGAVTHPDAGNLVGTSDLNGDGVAGEGDGYWRPQMLEEAAAYVKGLSDEYKQPVVWGGDFNSGLDGTYDDNVSWYKVADAGFTDATNGRYIDHIFYNGMATHLYETTVADAAVSGASDHKAVFADIQFLDEFATPIKDAKDSIKTQGRTTLKDGAMWLDYSASGIVFSANCEGKVALNLTVNSIKNTDATYGGIYFTVIVDGVTKDRAQCRITSTGNVVLVLAENLPAGNHTFEVYRQTEHRGAEVGISSIVMNGKFNAKPEDNRLYIEFIGDSISTGYGALGEAGADSADSPLWQDATVAYPYLTAKALGADFSDVCYSGLGCKYGYSGSLSMQTVYTAQRYQYDKNTQYNFNTRQPDVVVIALGTNDIANQTDASLRKVGYQEMLDLVRAKNPNAKIVWIYGMMKDDDNAMIASLIEENGGAAEGLYSLELVTNTAGAGWHPSKAGQQKFADDLVAFLNDEVLVKYVGNEMFDNEGVMDDVYSGEEHGKTSRMEMADGKLGLAFRFTINATGIVANNNVSDLTNAYVDVFGDGNQYKLLAMGAVVTNDPTIGMTSFTRADATNNKTIDIKANYVFEVDEENGTTSFAVRITNIPAEHEATVLYARGYYVFEYEGREITVYDEVFAANYINKYDSNDGVLEW